MFKRLNAVEDFDEWNVVRDRNVSYLAQGSPYVIRLLTLIIAGFFERRNEISIAKEVFAFFPFLPPSV